MLLWHVSMLEGSRELESEGASESELEMQSRLVCFSAVISSWCVHFARRLLPSPSKRGRLLSHTDSLTLTLVFIRSGAVRTHSNSDDAITCDRGFR